MAEGDRSFVVYVSNSGNGEIIVLRMASATAEPEVLQTLPIAGPGGGGFSTPMAVSPDRKFLHVAARKPPLPIATFAIGSDGQLTPLGLARLPGSTPYLAADRTGRYLFSVDNPGATVAVSAIGADGRIAPRAHQVLHIGHKLHCVAVAPDNRHVYVSSTDDGEIFQFLFDAGSGLLAPNDPPTLRLRAGGDPRHMVFSADGRFLYVTTEAGGRVAAFSVDAASGRLSELLDIGMMPEDFAGTPMTADLHLTPDGRFLYATERVLDTIVAYRVDAKTGALSLIEAYPTERKPRTFAIAPDGRFLLVAGQESARMTAYTIDHDRGTLSPGISLAVGPGPNWIEILDLDG